MVVLLILGGCSKEDECTDCLETFHCKINGEKWEPSCSDAAPVGWCEDIDCQYYIDDGHLALHLKNSNRNDRISFSSVNLYLNEAMTLINLRREYKDYSRGNCASYDLIQDLPNYIELTALDTINFTIEGNFAFSVLGRCDGDTLHITDGYFHLAYRF